MFKDLAVAGDGRLIESLFNILPEYDALSLSRHDDYLSHFAVPHDWREKRFDRVFPERGDLR